jgi:hypothetical protein
MMASQKGTNYCVSAVLRNARRTICTPQLRDITTPWISNFYVSHPADNSTCCDIIKDGRRSFINFA